MRSLQSVQSLPCMRGRAILVTVVLTAGLPALLSPGEHHMAPYLEPLQEGTSSGWHWGCMRTCACTGNKAAEKIFDRDARSGRKR